MLIGTDRLTGEDTRHVASLASRERLLLQLLCVQSQRNHLSWSVWTVSAAYGDRGVIIAEWSDCMDSYHGADGIWHLALSSSFITYYV